MKKLGAVTGVKWFDKVNGNTYHKVYIELENGDYYESSIKYGYGTQYLVTASDMLKKMGLNIEYHEVSRNFYTNEYDVLRKRDM